MGILLLFAPFIVFVVMERAFGAWEGLASGALLSTAMLLRSWLHAEARLHLLEAAIWLLFVGMTAYALAAGGDSWHLAELRFKVDAGLLAIVLLTLALRRPFTLQYARERVPHYVWTDRRYVRANYAMTAAWALAFALMALADLALWRLSAAPSSLPAEIAAGAVVAVTIAALWGAVKITGWCRERAASAGRR